MKNLLLILFCLPVIGFGQLGSEFFLKSKSSSSGIFFNPRFGLTSNIIERDYNVKSNFGLCLNYNLSYLPPDFKSEIKDTFEDEIADTVIRICDFCGWYGIELGEVKKIQTKPKGQYNSDLVSMDKLITATYDIVEKDVLSISLTCLLGMLESIAQVYNFDLEQHINLKLAYNATRGYKHGNKLL